MIEGLSWAWLYWRLCTHHFSWFTVGPITPHFAVGKLGFRVVNELLMRLIAALWLIAGKH